MNFNIIKSGTPMEPVKTKDRVTWPFKDMAIGDRVIIPEKLKMRSQTYAHVYGRQSGKKFTTAVCEGGLMVTRLK